MDASALDPELERLLDHSDWLRALARKLVGDAATADDLVQETWLAAMKSPPDPTRPVRPWLAGVVRRLARMRARGEGRRSRRQTEAARGDALPSTSELVENIDTQRRLASVVMELSEPYRTTVMLRYFEGVSSADIARRQGVPSGTVRWRLKRGLDELRERLDNTFGSRQSWCLAFLALERTQLLILGSGSGAVVSTGTVGVWAAGAAVVFAVFGLPNILDRYEVFASNSDLASVEPTSSLTAVDEVDVEPKYELERAASLGPARLRLIEEDRTPTEGLQCVLVLPDGSDLKASADEAGLLSFPTSATSGTLFVAREGCFLYVEEFEFQGEVQEVRMPAGSSLVGRVVDDSGAPVEELALRLDSDRLIWDGREFPEEVTRALGTPRLIRATTGPDGYFQFRGLAADWSGNLGLPPAVSLAGRNRREERGGVQHVEGPRTDLVIEVQHLPVVTGQVSGADGSFVANADVRIWLDNAENPLTTRTGEDGLFSLQLDDLAQSGLRVEAESSELGGLRSLEFGPGELPPSFDLGLIELATGRALEFLVSDASGAPIRGAVAFQPGAKTAHSPSDANGLGHIQLADDGEPVVEVDAPGYLSARVDIGGGLISIELESAPELRIVVRDGEGLPLPNLMVEVQSEERLFEEGESYSPSELDQVTMAGRPGEMVEGEKLGRFFLSADGDLSLAGVAAGMPLRVQLYDKLGESVATEDVAPLDVGELREIMIAVVNPLRTLDALVRDPAGELLVGALVKIAADGAHESVTKDDGLAHFDQIGTERVTVTVSMRGFATQTYVDYVLPPQGQTADFSLEPGFDVEVMVVDTLGQPVEGGRIFASGGESAVRVRGLPLSGSEQRLEDLPNRQATVTMYLGGNIYERTIDPSDGRLEFTVPEQARIGVNWTLPENDGAAEYRIVAGPATLDGKPIQRGPRPQASGPGRSRVVHEVAGGTSLTGAIQLVLGEGVWIVRLESSTLQPARGDWLVIGDPIVVEANLESQPVIQFSLTE